MPEPRRIDLSCPDCHWRQACGPQGTADWLRKAGMLKRNREPSADELAELLLAAAVRLPCPECGHDGLLARDAADEAEDWPDARPCQDCGRPISAERLEALPRATLCAACQRGEERGDPSVSEEADYCPRCGSPMTVRKSGGTGITRYVAVCSDFPRCRGK